MTSERQPRRPLRAAVFLGAGLFALGTAGHASADEIIELTQTGCQFVESENGVDHGFQTAKSEDCQRINAETAEKRLQAANVIKVKPGTYTFRVTNKNVPYELGFWLRESDYQPGNPLHKLSKISVSGGGLTEGKSNDYTVELKPGEYLYSCPLNPTPDYKLMVTAE